MVDTPPERPCGEMPRGSHGGHRYMLDGDLYHCPGGDVRASAPRVACAVLHLDGNGDTVPCPGYSEPDGGVKEPAPPPTVAEQVRDLERIIGRIREAVGTDMVLVSCEQHETRIGELTTALREVLAQFVHDTHPGRRCKQTGHVNVETLARWQSVLDGTDQEGQPA